MLDGGPENGEAPANPGDPRKDPFCSFWKGVDLRVCTEICTVLDEAGIPHKTIRRQDHLFNFNNQAPYEVGVPASLYEKAELAIQEAFGTDEQTGEDAVPLLPPPEEDLRTTKREVESGEWYPEDATALAWDGDAADWRNMIEMSLKENDIRMRWEMKDGKPQLFVLPEDEERAKEIVREILEGQPPE